jgi:hypothetical protein
MLLSESLRFGGKNLGGKKDVWREKGNLAVTDRLQNPAEFFCPAEFLQGRARMETFYLRYPRYLE